MTEDRTPRHAARLNAFGIGAEICFAGRNKITILDLIEQNGRIEQVGSPPELCDAPANTIIAAFIGSPAINMLKERATGGAVEVAGHRLQAAAAPDGRDVVFGVRPGFKPGDEIRPKPRGCAGRLFDPETGARI